jgi:hypothetical protein
VTAQLHTCSPGWRGLLEGALDDPSGRVLAFDVQETTIDGETIGLFRLRFTAEDIRGEQYEAAALLYLPVSLAQGGLTRAPVWFCCGYQVSDQVAVEHVRCGRIVVTSIDPHGDEVFPFHNPLCRGPNTDYVLAHLVRGLRFVDPQAVVYTGGSAGGYAALLVAAEAFPAPAVAVNAPPVNLAYQGSYMMRNFPRIAAEPPREHPLTGVLASVFLDFFDRGWVRGYGRDTGAPSWIAHSPIAHVDRITGPVAAFFSTADFLVPLEQVGVRVAGCATAPPGMTIRARDLSSAPEPAVRLLDVLGRDADVRVVPVPDGAVAARLDEIDLTMSRQVERVAVDASPTAGRRWLITVVDEGPMTFGIGHTRFVIQPDFEAFVERSLRNGIDVEQLTPAKLDQLLSRWSGREWLADGFRHLDRIEAERADVERGLRLYCEQSPGHAQRFHELYEAVDAQLRLLPEELVQSLALP